MMGELVRIGKAFPFFKHRTMAEVIAHEERAKLRDQKRKKPQPKAGERKPDNDSGESI